MTRDRGHQPPRVTEALLSMVLPRGEIQETVLGDLHELFAERAADPRVGVGAARRWYRIQAVRLMTRYLLARARRSNHHAAGTPHSRRGRGSAMRGVVQQIRFSLRSLARSPGFTLPALLILAIGMTAATAIFTVVDTIVLRPLNYPEAGQLVMLCEDHVRMNGACVASPGNVADLGSATQSLSRLGIGRGWQFRVEDETGSEGIRGGLATGGFFGALGVRPHLGRLFSPDEVGPDNDKVVLLSYGMWATRYGAQPSAVGATVRLDGEPVVIVGVLPPGFEAPLDMEGIQLWKPPHFNLLDPEVRGWRGWRAIGRLAAGVGVQAATTELRAHYGGLAAVHDEVNEEWHLQVRPLLDVVVGDTRPVFIAFLAAAGLLLMVVCANLANLLLARGLGRQGELAVRAALGADRRRLVAEILTESLVLAALATVLAVVLARGATALLVMVAPPEIPRLDEVVIDGRILAFAACVSVMSTIAFAVVPALRVTTWDLAQTIKSGTASLKGVSSSRLRSGLVVAELALSVVLLASAALLTRSFAGYLEWDPGFDTDRVVTVSAFLSPEKYETREELVPLYRAAETRLAAAPGILSVSSASAGPLFGGGDGEVQFSVPGEQSDRVRPSAKWFDVGPGLFATLGVTLLRGREFLESDDATSRPVVIVNQELARLAWPDDEPIGKILELPKQDLTLEVVGVVEDVPPMTPGARVTAEMYWPNRQQGRWGTFFVLRTEMGSDVSQTAIVEALLTVDPDLTLGTPRPLAAGEARALVRPRFQALVLLVFALAALALSAVGVYAVVSYAVERRMREVGIRIALGASSTDVVMLILRGTLGVAALGVALGSLGALLAGSLLGGMVHGVSPRDPASLGVAVLLLLGVTVLASLVPARRAAGADPLEAIRAD